jgi:branched-chain amino acid transport system substrate-binding protein
MSNFHSLSHRGGNALLSFACSLTLSALTLSCAPETISIALMTKLEAGSLVGSSEVNAARMAIDDAGLSSRVRIVPYDDAWQPDKAAQAWRQLRSDGIDLVITSHVSTCAIVIAELSAGQDVLVIVTGAATNELSGKDDENLRIVPDVDVEQKAIAQWMRDRNPSGILVVRDTDNWAYTEPALRSFARELGGLPFRELLVSIGAVDAPALKQGMLERPFDILYLLVGSHNAAAGTLAQLGRLVQPGCLVVFTPWMKTPALVETAGAALQGAYMPSFYPQRGSSPKVDGYIDRYKEKFGYAPTYISLNVYVAAELLAQRIGAGIRTPKALRASFVDSAVESSFGQLRFDRYGDAQLPLYMIDDIAGEF